MSNLIKIKSTLKTTTPLHVAGACCSCDKHGYVGKVISMVVKDSYGFPYIPGSVLRGNLRHLIETKINKSSEFLSGLFGTPVNASKIEFSDAKCINRDSLFLDFCFQQMDILDIKSGNEYLMLQNIQQEYINSPVKIEIVTIGIEFEFIIFGRNIDELELGLIFWALEKFNSKLCPITIGSLKANGFGRMQYQHISTQILSDVKFDSFFFGKSSDILNKIIWLQKKDIRELVKKACIGLDALVE